MAGSVARLFLLLPSLLVLISGAVVPSLPNDAGVVQPTSLPIPNVDQTITQTPESSTIVTVPTTEASTTTSSDITTTIAPTTTSSTSTPPITTTTEPSPTNGPPDSSKWIVNGTNGTVCIIAQMAAQFNIIYLSQVNATNTTKVHKILKLPAPEMTTFKGDCSELQQNLTITWGVTNHSLSLCFARNKTDTHYSLHMLNLVVMPEDLPNAVNLSMPLNLVHQAPEMFNVGLKESYRCGRNQSVELYPVMNNTAIVSAQITLSDLHMQAFRTDNSTVFGSVRDCILETSDAVPIFVGCALAAVVLIVLVTYITARRRSQSRGYNSM